MSIQIIEKIVFFGMLSGLIVVSIVTLKELVRQEKERK